MSEQTQPSQFQDTPQGNAKLFQVEFDSARKALEGWHKQGEKIVRRFLDEREGLASHTSRLNLFTANIQTQRAMLYGNTPKVSVARRFADAQDDVARVAGEMLERHLNSDIEKDGDTCAHALAMALDDRLLVGLGVARVRYQADFEKVEGKPATDKAPEVPATEQKSYECVEVDYVHWKDALWGVARVWSEVPWVAFKAQMTRDELIKRFGDVIGKAVPLNAKKSARADDTKTEDPWSRADVWEIWHKERRKVYWFVEGYAQTLDEKKDTLQLDGFFPCPRPMFANLTTSKLVPTPDFSLAQDLYNEIDEVTARIVQLEDAIAVRGAYDKSNEGLKGLLTNTNHNELLPIANFAALIEKGGIAAAIAWLPIEQTVAALTVLRDYRSELMNTLYQVTGMSDIMRGQGTDTATTATEQSIKARFGSVRMQAMQDEFARFASELQKLKAEIISKHFEPETIIKCSNVEMTSDAQFAQQAVQLIKSELGHYRVEVKPEAVSLTDFAALKTERMEVIQAIGGYLQIVGPLAQQMPSALPFLLQMLQVTVAGLRGASAYESILDQAIAQAQQQAAQPQQPQQPDPKLQVQQLKGQQDLEKVGAELQADLARTQADVQAEQAKQEAQTTQNVKEHALKLQLTRALKPPEQPKGPGMGGRPTP